MELFLTLVIVIGIFAVVSSALARKRHRLEEASQREREEASARALEAALPEVAQIYDYIHRLTDLESGYLMKRDWQAVLESAAPTIEALSTVPQERLDANDRAEQVSFIMQCCSDPDFLETRNARYKARELELYEQLFSDIDGGKSLDLQQRDAVVTDEYNNLIIAGAGSGKTAVVVGKVKYLVERWRVDPSEILVTSFTRASVNDLKERIEASGVHGVSARTFHAIGLRVLGDSYAVAPEDALSKHITTYLSERLATDSSQASAFLQFFGLWSISPEAREEHDGERAAELRMKALKAEDMRTLKGLVHEGSRDGVASTLLGERVKSVEELMIANFLFLNGVAYEYERPYDHEIPEELHDDQRRAYQPDFYLTDYDIWLEHFGIDENGRVPWMKTEVEEQRYLDGIEWKRKLHETCGTKLIESYSYWNKDQDLLNQLEALLKANGVELRIDPERNAQICGDLLRDERFFGSMTQLICTFITLVKSGNKTSAEVDDKAREAYKGSGTLWHRYDLFTRFAWPIYDSYQQSLAEGPKPLVDFDDMINRAAACIREEGFSERFRYIIVDEYQDISLSRFGLISAIRDATGAKLMCVGDDWQSIYRFAGSDVTLFTSFGQLVGDYAELRIEHTYRNSQTLVDVASRFVLKNPDQLRKAVRSMAPAHGYPPVAVVSHEDQRAALAFALNDLLSKVGEGGDVKILGRNRKDLERIFPGYEAVEGFSFRNPRRGDPSEEKFDKIVRYQRPGCPSSEIGYMTVHKSKGLQADGVVVLGLGNDRYGFPNMVADDTILELLLANSDRFDFAEERRLFYVALTRTRDRVWLVTGTDMASPGVSRFVDELREDCSEHELAYYRQEVLDEAARCPRCGGYLVRRQGANGTFVGCMNYPFCDRTYQDTRILDEKLKCPKCGGWLTRRARKDGSGEFYGCTNYPTYCTYTMNIGSAPAKQGAAHTANPGTSSDTREVQLHAVPTTASQADIEYRRPRLSEAQPKKKGRAPLCPVCGAPMVLRSGRYGAFYGCSRYPTCKGRRNYGEHDETVRGATTRRPAKSSGSPVCPHCGARMVLRVGRNGRFYGCTRYPSCKGTRQA